MVKFLLIVDFECMQNTKKKIENRKIFRGV
jgi:hypothetical protein